MKICVCGYGVVGQGVVDIIDRNDKDKVKYIFTREALEDKRHITDYQTVLKDDEVKIVVEAMGGIEPAYAMLKSALKKGKSVVTSNKELVVEKGTELHAIAKENHVHFLFEASVGGGIPLISAMRHGLSKENIFKIQGILNGTSNYILTNMRKDNVSFDVALKDAQLKGYAEKDPTDDIEGFDTGRKIAILGSILLQQELKFEDVQIHGIRNVSEAMFKYANDLGCRIRLVATVEKKNGTIYASVEPTLVNADHALYTVEGVDNAVLFQGEDVGEVMIKGAGAGRYPTASAMVADVYALDYEVPNTTTWNDGKVIVKEEDAFVIEFINDKPIRKNKSELTSKHYLALGETQCD